ncbi:MAG: tetratricopeptide repeat protein [candidate division WOR-3 bacterium]|nr:MAG: tetratricopeptide repeat protein [candidate division WOR-3 bacterium]
MLGNRVLRMTLGCLLALLSFGIAQVDSLDVFERANELLQNQQYDDALKAYEFFVQENPEHHLVPAAKWAIANVLFVVKKDYHRAALVYQNIISKHPGTGWEIFSLDRLGSCYEEQDRWGDAARSYESALEKLATPVHSELAPEWNDIFKTKVIACYRTLGDRLALISIYEKSLEQNPAGRSAPADHFELAGIHLEMKENLKAAKHYAMVVDRYPLSDYARRVRTEHGDLLTVQLGYDWTAFSTFERSVELSRSGRFDDASAGFDQVVEAEHTEGMDYAARFQIELIEFRKTGDAAAFLDRLRAISSDSPYGFGGIDVDQLFGRLQVIIDAKDAIAANPDDLEAYRSMASTYYETQAYYPAIEVCKRAVAIEGDNIVVYNILGYSHMGVREYDDASDTFGKLIKLAPNDPNSYDSMAEAQLFRGDTTQAIRFYEKAIAVDANFTNPYYMLGEIYHGINQVELARDYLQKYLELAPAGYRADAAQDILERITEM